MLIAEGRGAALDSEIQELISFGRRLQGLGAGTMGLWLLGGEGEALAYEVAEKSGISVTLIEGEELKDYLNEVFCQVIAAEIGAADPSFVCTSHTSRGWEWAPYVAARIGAACLCGVDGLMEYEGRFCFQKEIYGGKLKGLYAVSAATTVITIQPGAFKDDGPTASTQPALVTRKRVHPKARRSRYGGRKQAVAHTTRITSAPVIVAVGNGIGEPDHMELIHRLARRLPKAEVAGTRIICDRGWLGYDRQVGVTGATVSPALYLAFGISGASQHVMGMRGAGLVVAVNRDKSAPIFNEADICIVEDILQFIPLLESACERAMNLR